MKNIFMILMLVVLSVKGFTQTEYSVSLDFSPGRSDGLNNIQGYQDGFIVTGTFGLNLDSFWKQSGIIANIDKYGRTKWKNEITYDKEGFAYFDNNFLLSDTVKNRVIGVFNLALENERDKIYVLTIKDDSVNYNVLNFKSDSEVLGVSGIISKDKNIITSILTEGLQQTYIRLNSDLLIIDSVIIENDYYSIGSANNIIATKNNILHSYSYQDELGFTSLKIRELDSEFNIIREFTGLQSNAYRANAVTIPTEDNGFMVAWNKDLSHTLYDTFPYPTTIYKMDSAFNVEWEYVFVHRGAKEFSNFRSVGNGKYLGFGGSDYLSVVDHDPSPRGAYNAWTFLIDEDGSLVWEKQVFDTRYKGLNIFYDGVKTEFGYAFVGLLDTIKEEPNPFLNDPDSWYFTLDENGCWNGNCNEYILIDSDSTSYTYTSTTEVAKKKQELNVFPNPTSGILTIESDNTCQRRLILYDISGKKLLEQKLFGQKSTIDLSDLRSGIYFINVLNNREQIISNHRVIIQH